MDFGTVEKLQSKEQLQFPILPRIDTKEEISHTLVPS